MGMFQLVEPALRWLDDRVNSARRARWLHEARAPLAAIIGVVDLLVDGAHDEQREWLEAIRASAGALLTQADALDRAGDVNASIRGLGSASRATVGTSIGEGSDAIDQAAPHAAPASFTPTGARILVVIEREELRRDWLAALAGRGYTPYGAVDALDALRQLTLEAFDAALIDAKLDCLDAALLARAIRSRPGIESMPIGSIGLPAPSTAFDFAVEAPADLSERDTAPTARAPHRPARARARG